ncbi:MAG: TIGR03790 family protein [Comamonadaceae bacterium]|nr:TIGR03790 family protein [Comamonadaceae bacterium]
MNDGKSKFPKQTSSHWRLLIAAVLALAAAPLLAQPQTKRLTAQTLGLVINTADPYSVAVGDYYTLRRGIAPEQILRVTLPLRPTLTAAEFEALAVRVRDHMPAHVQGLALAWTQPYAVECNSLTSALTLGFQPDQCKQTCAPGVPSRLFNSSSTRPFTRYAMRPSMLLASRSVVSAMALIDRGVAADGQLGKLGGLPANAVFVSTQDQARNVRAPLFPREGPLLGRMTNVVRVEEGAAPAPAEPKPAEGQEATAPAFKQVVLYQTGAAIVTNMAAIGWLPGALADHLTSSGGHLLDRQGQTSALEWLEAGATASYGTVSEPCNHTQKFPHPEVLLAHYLQGVTALEAYWRSVAWPAQGVFIGEPLAAPYAR